MATWEYLGKRSLSKSLVVRKTLSRTAGTYGDSYVYDLERPEVSINLETQVGLTDEEAEALEATAMDPDGVVTVTDNAGRTHSGRIVSLSLDPERGTDLYQASLTLRPTTDEPA